MNQSNLAPDPGLGFSSAMDIPEKDAAGIPTITSETNATGNRNRPFKYQIAATDFPTSFDATGLPAGLSVDPNTGLISGTPTARGKFPVTLSATNDLGTSSTTLDLTIILPQADATTVA